MRAHLWLTSWVAVAASAMITAVVGTGVLHHDVSAPVTIAPNVVRDAPADLESSDASTTTPKNALSRDPFRAGGRLPNAWAAAAPPAETVLPVSVAAIRLLGTVIRPNGSFALCQLPTDAPRIVRLGEKLGEMTLISIEQGRATFQAPHGGRLDLSLSTPRS